MTATKMPDHLGRYQIIRELGKGAMGVVYEGLDPNIGRRVAIKTARRDVLESSAHASEMMERFLREARAAGALNHPNIITIYDAGEEEGVAYIAMEFLEGGDLRNLIEDRRNLTPEAAAAIGADICEALACAHDHGVVHRDIKPANVMMPRNAPIKLADFGIAHMSDSTLTQEGALIGTPFYMSPEQFMGQKVDGRSDLFSVAVMLYELLTGEKPFTGEALSTVMHHVIKTDPAPPQELNFNVPEPLGRVILKSMSKRPADRYQDGRAMAVALRESVKPQPNAAMLGLQPQSVKEADTVITSTAGDATAIVAKAGAEHAAEGIAATVTTAATLGATRPGGPPPDTQTAEPATSVQDKPRGPEAPAGVSPGSWVKPPRLYYAVGAAAAVLLVFALIVGLSGGAPQPGPEDPPRNGGVPVAPDGGAKPDKYLAAVRVAVYQTSDANLFGEYVGLNSMEEARAFFSGLRGDTRITPVPAKVQVLDPRGTRTFGQGVIGEEGDKVPCAEFPEAVRVRVWVAGSRAELEARQTDASNYDGELPYRVEADGPGVTSPIQNVLVLAQ